MNHTIETKQKISNSLTKFNPPFERNCPDCGNKQTYLNRGHLRRAERLNQICRFCKRKNDNDSNLYHKMGINSAKSQSRRSKNEIYFAELCQIQFNKVLVNEPIFNGWDADVILPTFKVAVLWNGKWHYEKLTEIHSLKQVQNRDAIKLKEIQKAGYISYIIKDMGKHDKNFVKVEFEKFNKFIQTLTNNAGLT